MEVQNKVETQKRVVPQVRPKSKRKRLQKAMEVTLKKVTLKKVTPMRARNPNPQSLQPLKEKILVEKIERQKRSLSLLKMTL